MQIVHDIFMTGQQRIHFICYIKQEPLLAAHVQNIEDIAQV